MPNNDSDYYNRIYSKLMGCEHVPPTRRERKLDFNDHPLWYFRTWKNNTVSNKIKHMLRRTELSAGEASRNKGKIPLVVVRCDGGQSRLDNIVCMRLKDFRDLLVGDRAGEIERERCGADFLEWLRPDVWGETVDVSPDEDADSTGQDV